MALNSFDNAQFQLQKRLAESLPAGIPIEQWLWEQSPKSPSFNDNAPWGRVTTTISSATDANPGGNWYRIAGIYVVDMFYPPATTGSYRSVGAQDVQHVVKLFNNKRFNNVNAEQSRPNPLGVEPETGLYQHQVLVPFYYEGPEI
jgi:hypothetical protein